MGFINAIANTYKHTCRLMNVIKKTSCLRIVIIIINLIQNSSRTNDLNNYKVNKFAQKGSFNFLPHTLHPHRNLKSHAQGMVRIESPSTAAMCIHIQSHKI